MANVLPFDIFRVRSLHTTMNAMVLILLKKNHSTVKSNEHTLFMRNTCKEKKFELALFRSILVTVPVDMHFISRSFPISLWSILVVETLVAYLTFRFKMDKNSDLCVIGILY